MSVTAPHSRHFEGGRPATAALKLVESTETNDERVTRDGRDD
jgi:hypothetical protein